MVKRSRRSYFLCGISFLLVWLVAREVVAQEYYQGRSEDVRAAPPRPVPQGQALVAAQPAAAAQAPNASAKLDEILKEIKALKSEIEKIKEELNIIKIRVTQRV